jgi:hypothetical protein
MREEEKAVWGRGSKFEKKGIDASPSRSQGGAAFMSLAEGRSSVIFNGSRFG